jgi:hypothetical protein
MVRLRVRRCFPAAPAPPVEPVQPMLRIRQSSARCRHWFFFFFFLPLVWWRQAGNCRVVIAEREGAGDSCIDAIAAVHTATWLA